MTRFHHLGLTAAAAAALGAGCGGSGFDRGSLVEAPSTVTTLTAAQIDAGTAASGLQALSGKAQCDVKVVALNFRTPGPKGEETNSSGALFVPAGACTARHHRNPARMTQAHDPLDLIQGVGQDHQHRDLAVGGEAAALMGA